MAYSYFDYKGTDTTIQTDILCVSTEHMYAFKVLSEDNSNVTLSDVALAATFTKTNAGVLCELDTAPSTKIRVIRSTPYDVLMHDFSNGAQFNADSVDEVYEQLLYLCQEIVEGKLIIDSSGKFGGPCAGGISKKELQTQTAAAYSAGDAAGYAAGTAAGKAVGDAEGYTRGYSEGEAAGKATCSGSGGSGSGGGSGGGQMTGGTILDEEGRPIYPVIVTFTEIGMNPQSSGGGTNGKNIISQTVAYSYIKNGTGGNNGKRDSLSVPSINIWGGGQIVGGSIPYTFQGEHNYQVRAAW